MHADPTLLSESECSGSNLPAFDFMSNRSSDHKVELQTGVEKKKKLQTVNDMMFQTNQSILEGWLQLPERCVPKPSQPGHEAVLFIQDLISPRGAKDSLMKQYLAQFLKLGS